MAETPTYYYETEIEWMGEKTLKLLGAKLPGIEAGAPPEFKGREGVWSPEHLFVASLNSCYTLTLLAIAEFSKVALVSISSSAKGKLEKLQRGGYQVTEIVVKPRVLLASPTDLSRMPRIFEKAKENCFVSNSIKSAIKIEPEVFHQQTPASPCPLGEVPADKHSPARPDK
jgi:organic hydroperoxide reductase OsmC/OhrA